MRISTIAFTEALWWEIGRLREESLKMNENNERTEEQLELNCRRKFI
jgi:hypothetical protein